MTEDDLHKAGVLVAPAKLHLIKKRGAGVEMCTVNTKKFFFQQEPLGLVQPKRLHTSTVYIEQLEKMLEGDMQ